MNKEQKAAVIDRVAQEIQEAEAVFAVDYRGISVPQAAELRTRLRDADASFRVVKNTLTERAADKAGADALKQLLEGPTAMTFVRGDAAAAAKALRDFGRAGNLLAFKGGWMNGEALSAEQMDAIARLPTREVLYGRLVGMVASPLTGLASALGGLVGGLARQLQQIAEQVDAIAQLPTRDVLYGRLVGMVASPLTGLASALGGLIGGLARQLQQIADQDLIGGAQPAAAATPTETSEE